MSDWKTEGLSGAEWGFRAALSLMAEHRVAIAFLILGQLIWALLGADFFGILPTKMSFVIHPVLPQFQPFAVFEALCTALFAVWLIGLFLRSLWVYPTYRAFVYAAFVSIAMSVGFGVCSWLSKIVAGIFVQFLIGMWVPAIAIFVNILLAAIVIGILVINRLFCIICQTLVDGAPSLVRSLQGVSGRLTRVGLTPILGTFLMIAIVWLFELFAGATFFSAGDHGVWESHAKSIVIFLLVLANNILFAALSVVWFLSPIHRPPEEATTWVVPEVSLQP